VSAVEPVGPVHTGARPMTADPRDPAFIEPAWVTCKACMGEGFVDVGEFVETCFDCNGEGEVEP
jgi:DnaJ-class molecular chaperone